MLLRLHVHAIAFERDNLKIVAANMLQNVEESATRIDPQGEKHTRVWQQIEIMT